jgi:hypothetical protein
MAKYRNPRKELETAEVEAMEAFDNEMKEPAKTVEDTVWKNRYGDLRRHTDAKVKEASDRVAELEHKLDQALRGQLKAPKSDAEIEAWVKEYPEFANILETIVQKRIGEATAKTTAKLKDLEQKEDNLNFEKALAELKKLHPDLDKLTSSPDFHTWLQSQSTRYQDAIYKSLNVDEAAFVIDKYKAVNGKASKSKVDDDVDPRDAAKVVRKSAAVEEPDSDGDYDFSESQIERESRKNPRWFDQNEDKIMEAHRKGKIHMDISGGAR